jgi:hypothetical protein
VPSSAAAASILESRSGGMEIDRFLRTTMSRMVVQG